MKDKVLFGLSNIHFVEFGTDANGEAQLGSNPYHLPGAVKMALDPETGEVKFKADNIDYYVDYSDNGYEGELEMALFPDDFKVRFLNYVPDGNGGVTQVKQKKKKAVAIIFQGEGDALGRRGILYNVALGAVKREYNTIEDNKDPKTATLPFKVSGDHETGIVQTCYNKGADGYDTIFSQPPLPVLPKVYALSTDTAVASGKTYYTVTATAVANPDDVELALYYEKSGSDQNATYALTEDKTVDSTKTYYTLEGSAVASPTGNPSTSKYYEASTISLQ